MGEPIELYSFFNSSTAFRVRTALELKGLSGPLRTRVPEVASAVACDTHQVAGKIIGLKQAAYERYSSSRLAARIGAVKNGSLRPGTGARSRKSQMKLEKITAAALLGCGVLLNTAMAADAFPARHVRIIVPSSVGGGADIIARQLGARLQQAWNQGVSVENKVGGSGNIGTLEVVRALPDGHTLLVQNSTMVTNLAMAAKKPYSPETDLTPIMLVGVSPLAVFSHSSSGVSSLKELAALANAKPGTISYGSCGVGTPHHFAMELVKIKLAMKIQHVGYKGCAPAVTDVLSGQVPFGIATANMIAPHVAAGRIKVLAVSGTKAYRLLPDAPTFDSQGISVQDFSIWYAVMGPANMPAHLVSRIAADIGKVLDTPAVQAALSTAGVEPLRGGAGDLAKRIRNESGQLTQLAKQANIQPE